MVSVVVVLLTSMRLTSSRTFGNKKKKKLHSDSVKFIQGSRKEDVVFGRRGAITFILGEGTPAFSRGPLTGPRPYGLLAGHQLVMKTDDRSIDQHIQCQGNKQIPVYVIPGGRVNMNTQ